MKDSSALISIGKSPTAQANKTTATKAISIGDFLELKVACVTFRLQYLGRKKEERHLVRVVINDNFIPCNNEQLDFLLRHGQIVPLEIEKNSSLISDLMEVVNAEYTTQLIKQPMATEQDSISIHSAPVSEMMHNQKNGTCYAHACATAISAVQGRIVGREVQSHKELVEEIVARYGDNGADEAEVLKTFCARKTSRLRTNQWNQ